MTAVPDAQLFDTARFTRTRAAGPGLIIDNFAGGGGASTGIEAALGRPIDIAINHDPEAVAMHAANHPATKHYCQSVWQADPEEVAGGRPVDLAWFSPDCKHFSKAKGGKPVERNIRDLAWVVALWAQRVRPAVIMLENVEEFRTWGPLGEDGLPIAVSRGETFEKWLRELRKAGYKVQHRELRACDYGAPTSRKRLFVIARCDGLPIVWPKPTHARGGAGGLKPWKTAADIIDWSIPCPSIFERKRPLAEATLRRIAHGVMRYAVNAAKPFVVPLTHHGAPTRVYDVDEPIPTVTAAHRGEMAFVSPMIAPICHTKGGNRVNGPLDPLVTITTAKGGELALATATLLAPHINTNRNAQKPFTGYDEPTHTITAGGAHQNLIAATLVQTGYGEREGQRPRALDVEEPLGTVVAGGNKHAVVAAFMAQHYTGQVGRPADEPVSTIVHRGTQQQVVVAHMEQANTGLIGHDAREPVSTIVGKGCTQRLVTSNLVKLRGTCADGQPVDDPVPTLTAGGSHVGEVRAFLVKYYGVAGNYGDLTEPPATVVTKDRFALVTVEGEVYEIADIGMRMLTPRELFRAQGFPDSYIIDPPVNGRPMTKTSQIARCGNSVCPPLAEALVRANIAPQSEREAA